MIYLLILNAIATVYFYFSLRKAEAEICEKEQTIYFLQKAVFHYQQKEYREHDNL